MNINQSICKQKMTKCWIMLQQNNNLFGLAGNETGAGVEIVDVGFSAQLSSVSAGRIFPPPGGVAPASAPVVSPGVVRTGLPPPPVVGAGGPPAPVVRTGAPAPSPSTSISSMPGRNNIVIQGDVRR